MSHRKDQILELLKENPDDVFLNYALGLEYFSENNLNLAEQQMKKVVQIDANYTSAYYQLGLILIEQNKEQEALEYLKKGLEIALEKNNLKEISEFKSLITNIKNELI
ncbi:MAG TPA: hypothetical protein PK995_05195 [Bacteroidia bacterium]|nr:hypothetical protein [Bacteroidia bacterium]